MIRVTHLRKKCIGCFSCVELAPARWAMSVKDGKSILIGSKEKRGIYSALIPDVEKEELQKAARHCPVKIIRI